ncbi:hypothetical protein [Kitasatospora sp. NPDC059571]|uniref:hypothetical protein n=1 Tax=Kitasatospora sp. NPDC059571 TaxID=3346871 RepID=UPI00368790DA
MGLEDDLTGLLVESVGELSPPVAEMVAQGKAAGRRRIRVRRAAQAAGAALTVAAMVTAGAVVGLGRSGHDPVGAAAPAASGPAAGGGASTAASPSPTGEPANAVMTWQAMLKILSDELPPGGHLADLDPFAVKFNTAPTSRYIELQYDDGRGPSTVMLTLTHRADPPASGRPDASGRAVVPPASAFTCATWRGGSDEGPRRPGSEKPVCEESVLPDGSLMRSYITGVDVVGLYDVAVELTRPNGDRISVFAANGTLDRGPGKTGHGITITRDRPPLGLAGWQSVLKSPRWQWKVPQSVVDAGAAFAGQVSRFPCPKDVKRTDCVID